MRQLVYFDAAEPGEDTERYKVTLARMLVATDNEVGARQLVEAVLADNPGNVEALKMSATWLIDQDQADEAISSLRRALDQEPEDAETMTLMARAHERNGNAQLAQDLLALDGERRREDPRSEQINDPANPEHYWRYRCHVSLDGTEPQTLEVELRRLAERSGRL